MKEYDVAVIGAGSGGLVAATTANRLGLKTALIEKNKIGGECTHYGCVPSKAMIYSAKLFEAAKHSTKYGLPEINIRTNFEFSKVMEHVDGIVQGIYKHETPEIFEQQGIDVYVDPSGAGFIDNKKIRIGNKTIAANNTIICTGSSPGKVEVEGSDHIEFLHNENFWSIRKLPESIVFIGGGVISAELGQVLARFGSHVTIVDRNSRILKVLDDEVAEVIIGQFKNEGINLVSKAELKEFRKTDKKITVVLEVDGETTQLETDAVFIASGRTPNMHGMNLENAGIKYTERGIVTNKYLQTTADNIYACGDVATPLKFTHTASHQANICVKNIMEGNVKPNDLTILPWAIFTEPEIAHVGLSEKQAREKFGDTVQVFKVDAAIDRFITDSKTTGFLKVIFDENDNVIGADGIGEHSGEWIQLLTLAMKNKIPAESFADTIFAYPTYSEIVKKVFTRFLRTKQ